MASVDDDDETLALTAHRPESHRYRRLAEILARVEQALAAAGEIARWPGALRRLDDSKGDLTAYWRSDDDRARFSDFINRVWSDLGEDGDDVIHSVLEK